MLLTKLQFDEVSPIRIWTGFSIADCAVPTQGSMVRVARKTVNSLIEFSA
jgi:hypothetical protein